MANIKKKSRRMSVSTYCDLPNIIHSLWEMGIKYKSIDWEKLISALHFKVEDELFTHFFFGRVFGNTEFEKWMNSQYLKNYNPDFEEELETKGFHISDKGIVIPQNYGNKADKLSGKQVGVHMNLATKVMDDMLENEGCNKVRIISSDRDFKPIIKRCPKDKVVEIVLFTNDPSDKDRYKNIRTKGLYTIRVIDAGFIQQFVKKRKKW